ncbi:hypothetical protein [Tolypothrix sp. VBCCA 56010]|uniref:hypothetical protein n=1 Tax=Tolypothrix sp. VBCCA 56010 TaxID=3137731 RepID=UPI003D7E201F
MFSKQQLQVLLDAESGDDWTIEYFLERLPEIAEQSDISGAEFDNLMIWISSLSREEVYTLQMALIGLLDLPAYKDSFEV